ncbi:DUF4097 family beta strand repeat-containing protein [Actinomadura fibrosa]|uniref:DUF4097 domain-containing protein n=1 Tax=Actinomadura fibrosa TaxID=111802 RepID=A0ABW2XQ15_9ACTN|nr:DUF4097 family beta strand repeat-containing protein [Actinomadura fibrosa]
MRTLTAVVVLAGLAAAATGCGVDRHEEEHSYAGPAGVNALRVKVSGGRVELRATDAPGITVHETRRWSNDHNKPKATHTTEGSTLVLSSKCARNVIGVSACGISYRVEVPRSTAIEVDNGDGSIVASGLAGAVRLTTSSGSIKASDLRTSSLTAHSGDGSLKISGRATAADLRTDSGSITATGLTSDRLTARSGDGSVRVTGRVAAADLRTSSGSIITEELSADRVAVRTGDGRIQLGLTTPPQDVRANTNSGSVRVRLPGGEGYAFTLDSSSGSKTIDPAVHHDSQSRRHVNVSTGDGNITVSPA